jgi:hypothetical protein
MDLQAYGPARAQHGLITHQQALAAGLDARDVARLVASGEWARLRKGVYADGEAYAAAEPFREAPLLRMRAVVLSVGTEPVFTHDSAAIVHRLGVPDARTSPPHIARVSRRATRTSGGIILHGAPLGRDQVMRVDGFLVTEPARTALDMARLHGLWPGMAACDAALRRGVQRADLELAAELMQGWPYKRLVDRAIHLADPGAESYLESLARGLVIEMCIGTPQTQFGLSDGNREAWCDLRVGRHLFEADGLLKYDEDPERALLEEKKRQDFLSGFKLGASRITVHDCFAGRRAALRRLGREYDDTCRRFGTSIDDLTPYLLPRSARVPGV